MGTILRRTHQAQLALLMAGLLSQSPLPTGAQSYEFGVRSPVPFHPNCTVAADFNNDGFLDIMVPSWSPNTVAVLLGNGTATLAPAIASSIFGPGGGGGGGPRNAVAADFNGDGILDVATANSESGDVAIVLGVGNGTFTPLRRVSTSGTIPFHLQTGDLNGDGFVDLVVANSGSGTIMPMLGNGAGNFTPTGLKTVGNTPRAVCLRDFNGDGKLDVAVSNFGSTNVSVMYGNGLGGFGPATTYPTGINPFTLTAADVNNDGRLDLIVPNFGSATVSILLGTASGFTPGATLLAGKSARAVVAADFDHDGNVDLAVGNYGNNNVTILRGSGFGGFDYIGAFGVGDGPYNICVADLDNDGFLDIFSADRDGASVSMLKGSGLNFTAPQAYTVGSNPRGLAAFDFNHDGLMDLVSANNTGNNASYMRGLPGGKLSAPVNFTTDSGPWGIAIADVNGDGEMDVLTANASKNTVSVLRGTGTNSFLAQQKWPVASGPRAIAVADFNHDGRPDIATANFGANNVSVLIGTGSGNFAAQVTYPADAGPNGIVAADLNNDGNIDLAVANATAGNVSILLGTANGWFSPASQFFAGNTPSSIDAGDFDGDGDMDLVIANENANTITVLLGNASGAFPTFVNYPTGVRPLNVKVADVTEDGILDIVTANATSHSVMVHPGLGNGSFGAAIPLPAASFARALALADFNGDGQTDIAVGNADDNNAWIIFNRSAHPADLAVAVSNGSTFVNTGSAQTYTVTINNLGPTTINSLNLNYTAGAALHVTGTTPSSGSYIAGNGLWTGLNLASGGSVTLAIAGNVDSAATGTLTVSATASMILGFVDDILANNTASDSDTILAPAPPGFPTAIPQNYTVAEDGNVSIVLTASDPENDPITFAVTQAPLHGALTGTVPNLVYAPAPNYNGPDSFKFSATDVTGASTATISINVTPVNDGPTAAGASYTTDEDVSVAITLIGSDVDGDALTFSILNPPTIGTLSGSGSGRTYTPFQNVSGSDSFTFRVSDPSNAQSSIVTVNITVNPVNDVPTLVVPIPDQGELGPGTLITVDLTGRFSDVETPGASLVYTASSSNPGLVSPSISGLTLNLNLTPGQNGSSTVTVRATDAAGAWVETFFLVSVSRDGVKISINDVAAGEGGSGNTFTISLSAPSPLTTLVSYSTIPGTALAGVDYTPISGTLSFPPGTLTRTVRVLSLQDVIDEIDETFIVRLNSPINASIDKGDGLGTILDNDAAALNIADITVTEGDTGTATATFTVTLSLPSTRDISVNFNTLNNSALNGKDYTTNSGILLFPAGSTASQTISVELLNDLLDENAEAFNVILSNPINATLSRTTARCTINDNDLPPSVSVTDVSITEGNAGTKSMIFTLTLSAPSEIRGRVQYATADGTALAGSDYVAKTGEVTFDPGVTVRTVPITINGNTVAEPDETLILNLLNPTIITIATPSATGTILNDD